MIFFRVIDALTWDDIASINNFWPYVKGCLIPIIMQETNENDQSPITKNGTREKKNLFNRRFSENSQKILPNFQRIFQNFLRIF